MHLRFLPIFTGPHSSTSNTSGRSVERVMAASGWFQTDAYRAASLWKILRRLVLARSRVRRLAAGRFFPALLM